MPVVGDVARELILPAIKQAIAQHEFDGCYIREGAADRALAACIASLKSDETRCTSEEDQMKTGY